MALNTVHLEIVGMHDINDGLGTKIDLGFSSAVPYYNVQILYTTEYGLAMDWLGKNVHTGSIIGFDARILTPESQIYRFLVKDQFLVYYNYNPSRAATTMSKLEGVLFDSGLKFVASRGSSDAARTVFGRKRGLEEEIASSKSKSSSKSKTMEALKSLMGNSHSMIGAKLNWWSQINIVEPLLRLLVALLD